MLEEDFDNIAQTTQIVNSIEQQQLSIQQFLLTKDARYQETYEAAKTSLQTLYVNEAFQQEPYASLYNDLINWQNTIESTVLLRSSLSQPNISAYTASLPTIQSIQAAYNDAISTQIAAVEAFREELKTQVMIYNILLIVFSIVVAVICLYIARNIINMIVKPIRRIMHRMSSITEGDLTYAPLKIESNDELGKVTAETNQMTEKLQAIVRSIQTEASNLSTTSANLKATSTEVNKGTADTAQVINDIAQGAESQATAASDLRDLMTHFTLVLDETYENSLEIDQLSSAVYEKANSGLKIMDQSEIQMKKIDTLVQQSVQQVSHLNERTQEISQLVNVITSIADQTNLLSLNAAIEAARAGEHGKGFAVVADEVRKLSEQVTDSVKTISSIVHTIQTEAGSVTDALQNGYIEVAKGYDQVISSHATYTEISEALSTMVSTTKQMANQLDAIQTESQKIDQSIEQIAAVTEQSAASSEETAATIQEVASSMDGISTQADHLASSANKLSHVSHQFKLPTM